MVAVVVVEQVEVVLVEYVHERVCLGTHPCPLVTEL